MHARGEIPRTFAHRVGLDYTSKYNLIVLPSLVCIDVLVCVFIDVAP